MNRILLSRVIKTQRTTTRLSIRFISLPKHEVVNMPSLSPTMSVGTISAWKKQVGDKCIPGDTIAEIETG